MNNYIYIDNTSGLRGLVQRMKDAPRIALDTEADSLYHYYEKVCLIQITLGEENFIIDPLAGLDLTQFLRVLTEKTIILHSADYDLRLLRASYGFFPETEVFDTMLAAQLLGHSKLGLAALIERYFGVTLSKHGQKFNWSLRPLPEKKLIYASNDTRYLGPLMDLMSKELSRLGRQEWQRESSASLVQTTRIDRPPKAPDSIWRIKGWKGLNRPQLAFVRSLWYWRENEAKNADLPPFKILGNAQLIKLSLWVHSHPEIPLSRGPKLPRTCRGDRLRALNSKIAETNNLPESQWPRLKAKRKKRKYSYLPLSEKQALMLNSLREETKSIASGLGITPSVLASRATIESIIRAEAVTIDELRSCEKISRWQAELLAPAVKRIFKPYRP
ncbi:MAG: hypothetical protein U9N73_06815 [Candidatus Auribacterota bacterium]|nr:hypothetical protein [Candidatus Auribacterota bacterium]